MVIEDREYANRVYSMLLMFAPQGSMATMRVGALQAEDIVNANTKVGYPLAGLFGCLSVDKLWPLRYAPMTLEFELVTSVDDIMRPTVDIGGGVTGQSASWSIIDPTVSDDVCVIHTRLFEQRESKYDPA